MPLTEKIPDALVGERLDRVVSMIALCTRAQAVQLIESGNVTLSGRIFKAKSHKVQKNQTIIIDDALIHVDHGPLGDFNIKIQVVHEDDYLYVIEKPAGLVVHPGAGNQTGTLVNGLLAMNPSLLDVGQPDRPGIVHRLDKNTSGLMIVAKEQVCYERLVQMMSKHLVDRSYLALVHGSVEADKGVIDGPIGRSSSHATQMVLSQGGRDAVTRYEVRARYHMPVEATLVELGLETGRTHQIRVHMRAIGHSVVGDQLYSKKSSLGLQRTFLHSFKIKFSHPITDQVLSFTSDLPEDLANFIKLFK